MTASVTREGPTGNLLTSWAALTNTIIDTGLLSMASALSTCGWVLGMAMFAFFGGLALFSLVLLNAICMVLPTTQQFSFFTACDAAGVPHLKWLIDCILILNNLGFNVVYLQVSATLISTLLEHWSSGFLAYSGIGYRFIVLSVVLLLLSPICLMRHITGTTIANVAGIIGFTYVVCAGVSYVIMHAEAQSTHSLWPSSDALRVLGVLPVFIFAFAGHFNVFLVAEDLRDRTLKRLNLVAISTIVFTTALFLPAMCVPYAILSGEVKDNFYENLSIEDVAVHIGQAILPCAILSSYPLLLLPARASMINLIVMILPDHKERRWLHVSTTIGFMLVTLVLAATIKSLGSTMALIGLLGANTMTFVAPSYLYVKIFDRTRERISTRKVSLCASGESSCVTEDTLEVGLGAKEHNYTWWGAAILFVASCLLYPLCLSGIIYTLIISSTTAV
ncbi:hypothetical protein FOL47_005699 [Perkinsus chesapeaki]|uniref:Amino acid transporter transmembrane domain-containing protein n=1 Tax=Perkinsus chesapeaki TaxID=330153 RepID=A0A7J6LWC2_PERCH|nr:hypothetical protein FOL47_005699 [Perkinsus chesapeaki]